MYADGTSILNIAYDINKLQKTTSENTVLEQYFETNNLSINQTKINYIFFQMKQCRQESELKILIKNWEIVNVKSNDFLGVISDINLSWGVHIKRAFSSISHNFFIINRLSKILDMNSRSILYYGLIYPFLPCGIVVWGQSVMALTR
jgi:hypothetical protein